MKRLFVALLACASLAGAQARIADVSAPEPLLRGTQSNLYNPVLSPDGTKLLFSKSDHSGLRMYDYNLGVTVTISDEARAGYNPVFSPDSRSVNFVTQTTDDRGLNMRVERSYDIATGTWTAVAPAARRVAPLARRSGNTAVRTDGATLYITANGTEKAYNPVEAPAYLWASVSPDGSRVMFVAAGKGIYVTDLNGNIISFAGDFEAPVWYGNDCIVAMNATDDGHQFSSSQIVLVRADGSEIQEITRPESMTMTPAASIEAGRIVYSTIDGFLYQVNVTLK